MTNYRFYEKEIIKILRSGDYVAVSNGMPTGCDEVECEKCDFSKDCHKGLGEWLAEEHIETDNDKK